jgi:hypothetical protein
VGIHLFFLALYASLSGAFDAISICAILILHCIVKIVSDVKTGKRGLHIMTTYYIGVIITTFANLYHIYSINIHGVNEFSMYAYIVPQYIDDAISVWAIGNTFIFIGYDLFANKGFPSILVDITTEKNITKLYNFILIFSFLSLTGSIANFAAITGGIQKVLSLLNIMGILYFARLWAVDGNIKFRNHAIVLCALQTLVALYTSYLRLELLTPTISFFGGYFIGKGSLKYIYSYRAMPVIVILFIFSLFFNSLSGNRSHFITTFTGGDESIASSSGISTAIEEEDRGNVIDRVSNVAQITNVISLVETKGHYNGVASFPLLAAFVPRVLWPDKPQVQLGVWFALEIGVATISASGRANNSVNMTIPGELFLDFGWIGLGIGGILFGGLLALFWNAAKFNESAYNISGALWGGYLLLYSLYGVGADLQIVVSLTSTYLVLLLFKKIVKPYENIVGRASLARQ